MADIHHLRGDPHEEVQTLLPWYVNGSLSAEESHLVEEHLAHCEACRAELASERKLARSIADLPHDTEHGWAAMSRRLAKRPAPLPGPIALFSRQIPVGWAVGGSLAAAASVALAFTFVPSPEPRGETYQALGSPSTATEGNIVVLFSPETTARQQQVILSSSKARIVDGPNPAGALVLRVDPANRDAALQSLRATSQIVLAEPIGPER